MGRLVIASITAALAGASFASAMPAPNPQASGSTGTENCPQLGSSEAETIPGWPTIKSTAESEEGTGAYNIVANDPLETEYPSYNCGGIATGWIWFEYLQTVNGHYKWAFNMNDILPNDADRKIGALVASAPPASPSPVPTTSSAPVIPKTTSSITVSHPTGSTPTPSLASSVTPPTTALLPSTSPGSLAAPTVPITSNIPAVSSNTPASPASASSENSTVSSTPGAIPANSSVNVRSSAHVPVGAIVGGVVGPILVLMLIALWFYCRRRRGARISPGKSIFSVGGISTPAETTTTAMSESESGMLLSSPGDDVSGRGTPQTIPVMKHSGRRVGAPNLVPSLQPQTANTNDLEGHGGNSPASRSLLERQLQFMALRVAQAEARLHPEGSQQEEEEPPDYAAAVAAAH